MENSKTKTLHSLALPYPQPEWPSITPEIEDTLLTLLLPLLQPVGQYRKTLQQASQVQRNRRKNKKRSENKYSTRRTAPQIPDILEHLTIGFNSTVRRLEDLSQQARVPPSKQVRLNEYPANLQPCKLAVILVYRKAIPDLVCESFPLLVASAALHNSIADQVKLVSISTKGESLVARSLSQPRIAILGLARSAPGSAALLQYLEETIQSVQAPWLRQSPDPSYYPVNIKGAEARIGTSKARKREGGDE